MQLYDDQQRVPKDLPLRAILKVIPSLMNKMIVSLQDG